MSDAADAGGPGDPAGTETRAAAPAPGRGPAGAPRTASPGTARRAEGPRGRPGIGRALATVGVWTLASRLLGFARDIAIAATLGASPAAEAFLVAFSLPNMFRRFFAEGAFNMAFVPLFAKKLEAERPERRPAPAPVPADADPAAVLGTPEAPTAAAPPTLGAPGPLPPSSDRLAGPEDRAAGGPDRFGPEGSLGFARDAFTGLATVLIAFTVVATAAMPALVLLMASGFAQDERFDLAVLYGRIAFPYILLISLAALLSGVLNALGRFVAAAAAPVLLNMLFLAAIGAAVAMGWPVGLALAWAVPVAGAAQLALVWWAAARAGYRLVPRRPRLTPELRRLAVIAAPAMLAGGVVQVNLLVGRQVASHFEGAIAWLSYADRLYQLPLGVVGIATGVVLLPDLSRRLQAGDAEGGRAAFSRAGEIGMALTIPASVALVAIPGPIVAVLFERGAFSAEDARATAIAVAIYGAGLPAFVMQKVLQPLYFARHDTRRPFRYALAALAVNAGVAVGLSPVLGYAAAAWGTTLAGWAMLWLLWRGTGGMGDVARLDARFASRLWRVCAASAAMGAALWLAARAAAPLLAGPAGVPALAALVLGGVLAYGLMGRALGAFRLAEIRAALRR